MSLRATTDHTDHYGRVHLFEIYDDQWDGGVTAHKNTGEGFANFSHQKIDPRKPWENPIQKGALELSIWLEDSTQEQLLIDIKTGDEQQFYVIHYVDGVQEWQGYIYNDLTTYEENILPYRCTLMAKDFTDLSGKDYALSDNRETVIETIAGLLGQIGFNIPIKTHTSWVEEHITASQDYLRQIYNETKALREFGRTGDETDQPITIEEALNKLLVSHGLILKQTSGAYWIDQLTEYEDPLNVLEAEYDLTGTLQTETADNDLTVPANTPDLSVVFDYDNRDNSGLPGLKRVKNKFDHRTKVSNIQFPETTFVLDSDEPIREFQQVFLSDGSQQIFIDVRVNASSPSDTGMQWAWRIQAGTHWWDNTNEEWDKNATGANLLDMTGGTLQDAQGNYRYVGFLTLTTTETPPDADGQLTIEFRRAANGGFQDTDITLFGFEIKSAIAVENSTSIDYQLAQNDNYSTTITLDDTWFGDAPVAYSTAALRYDIETGDTTADTWQRRGSTAYRNFHHNLLAEQLDTQRGWRNLKSGLLKGLYYPWQVLDYDGDYFYYLGGSWDIWTGNWTVELFQLDIQTSGTDTFVDIPKFTDETGSGSGSTSTGGGGGGGLDQGTADARYFKQANNLSEGDPATIRSNIGTVIGSDVQAWSATLDDLSANLTATASELNRLDGDLATVQANLGLKDGSADLDFNNLNVNNQLIFGVATKNGTEYRLRAKNSGDRFWMVPEEDGNSSFSKEFGYDWSTGNWYFDDTVEVGGLLTAQGGAHITGGNVGIGTTNPSEALDVNGNINVSGGSTFNGNIAINESRVEYIHDSDDGDLFFSRLDFNGNNTANLVFGRNFSFDSSDTDIFSLNDQAGLDVHGLLTAEDNVLLNTLAGTESYTSGILGSGTIWDMDDSAGVGRTFFEVDNMRVRNALRVHIFKKDIVRASNGFLMITDSAQIVEDKVLADNTAGQTLRIKKGDGNSTFSVGDLLWAKNIDESGGGLTVNGLQATITAIDTNPSDYVELTLDTGSGGNGGEVFDGDTIVRVSGPNILNDASSTNAPFLDMYSGVNTWSDFYQNNTGNDKLKVRLGRLDGVTRQGINLSGFGLFSERVRLTKDILIGDFTEDSNYLKVDAVTSAMTADFDDISFSSNTFNLNAGNGDLVIDSSTPEISLANNNILFTTNGPDGSGVEPAGSTAIRIARDGDAGSAGRYNYLSTFWSDSNNWGQEFYVSNTELFFAGVDAGTQRVSMLDGIFEATPSQLNLSGWIATSDLLNNGDTYLYANNGGRIEAGGGDNRAGITGQDDVSYNGTGSGKYYVTLWAGGTFDDLANANFKVNRGGDLYANSAYIEGEVHANSGKIANWLIQTNQLESTNLSGGGDGVFTNSGIAINSNGWLSAPAFALGNSQSRIAGSYFDATDMWGGASSKSNASVRLDFDNGRIYYDAMGAVVYQRSQEATGSSNNNAPSIGNIEYITKATVVPSGGSANNSSTKVRFLYKKKYGVDSLDFFFKGRKELTDSSAIETCTVGFNFPDASGANDSYEIQRESATYSNSYSKKNVSVTSLNDGVIYEVEIELEIDVTHTSGVDVEAYLRNDITVVEKTD